jgi:hypothetical protein
MAAVKDKVMKVTTGDKIKRFARGGWCKMFGESASVLKKEQKLF